MNLKNQDIKLKNMKVNLVVALIPATVAAQTKSTFRLKIKTNLL